MFMYEDMDYKALTSDPDIDPDDPDVLYALAQCCRTGKGIEASEENYRSYLQRAADAGSQQAQDELDKLDDTKVEEEPDTPEDADNIDEMTLPELMKAAQDGNPYALLPLAKAAIDDESDENLAKAKEWLESAASMVSHGIYSDWDATEIYLLLGWLLKDPAFEDKENSHRCYGLAAELGSREACAELAWQFREGYGCAKDLDQAEVFEQREKELADPAERCQDCIDMLSQPNPTIEVSDMLRRIREDSQDTDVLFCADLIAAAYDLETPNIDAVKWAWNLERDGDVELSLKGMPQPLEPDGHTYSLYLEPLLGIIYGDDPKAAVNDGLPVDERIAGCLALWMQNFRDGVAWAQYGSEKGNAYAMYALALYKETGKFVEKDPEGAFALCQRSAQAGFVLAQAKLAGYYRNGFGTQKNNDQCLFWGKKAADAGNADAIYELGRLYYDKSDYANAKPLLESAAQKNQGDAFAYLGRMYEYGCGVPKDVARAIQCYTSGTQLDSAAAYFSLAYDYEYGIGVAQDYAKAVSLYQKAISLGNHPTAQNNLGVMYEKGQGVPKDTAKAAELYKKAAEQNESYAITNLANFYTSGTGVPRNYEKAFELYKKAEAMGRVRYIPLSNCYMLGRGTEKDYALAYSYTIGAYEKDGVSREQTGINLMNLANNVKKDGAAFDLIPVYTKAAEFGNTNALVALAHAYENGDGVEKDLDKAKEYYEKAAKAGSEEAIKWFLPDEKDSDHCQNIGKELRILAGDADSYSRAEQTLLYTTAAAFGDKDAMHILADAYTNGNGVEKDSVKAGIYRRDYEGKAAPGKDDRERLFSLANEMLTTGIHVEKLPRIKLMLSLYKDDAEAADLLKKLTAQETTAENMYRTALEHRDKRDAARAENNRTLITIEYAQYKNGLAEAMRNGSTDAAKDLAQLLLAEANLQRAESLLPKQSDPDTRRKIEELLQRGVDCGVPKSEETLAPLLEEDKKAEEKYARAMELFKENTKDSHTKGLHLLHECSTLGHKKAFEYMQILRKDYIDEHSGNDESSRAAAAESWDTMYGASQVDTEELLKRAKDMLNTPCTQADIKDVLNKLGNLPENPDAEKLRRDLQKHSTEIAEILDNAKDHMQKQKDLCLEKKKYSAAQEQTQVMQLLEKASKKGSAEAAAELERRRSGENALRCAEKLMIDRSSPATRAQAKRLLQQAAACDLPKARDLMDIMRKEDSDAEYRYQEAMTMLNAGGLKKQFKARELLRQNKAVGHTDSIDVLEKLEEKENGTSRSSGTARNANQSSTFNENCTINNDREELGVKLCSDLLLFVISVGLGDILVHIPVLGSICAFIFSITSLVALIAACCTVYKMAFVYHVFFLNADVCKGYRKAPQIMWNKFLSLFGK